jgi:hypothetical protein
MCRWVVRHRKARGAELLGAQRISLDELAEALGALPSWLAGVGGATERLDWLNALLAQVAMARVKNAMLYDHILDMRAKHVLDRTFPLISPPRQGLAGA